MNNQSLTEALLLYLPLAVAAVLTVNLRIYSRLKVAILVNSFWIAATLPWADLLCQSLGFWNYTAKGPVFVAIPLTFYFGWVIWWGYVAALLLGKLPVRHAWIFIILMILGCDLLAMPLCKNSVQLNENWVVGELIVLLLTFLPGLWLSHLTLTWKNTCSRAFMLSIGFGLFCLTLPPFMAGSSWEEVRSVILSVPRWQHIIYLGAFFLVTVPAVAAVVAFAKLGKGTPIPQDPPSRLVTTQVYSFIANPIQFGTVSSLLLWAIYLEFQVYWILAMVSLIYSIGIARWSEQVDMKSRFGHPWKTYQQQVKQWRFCILPLQTKDKATLYVALNCDPCEAVAKWLADKQPTALKIEDESNWQGEQALLRITYQHPCGAIDQGIGAIAASLQHLHLGWAYLGWLISYPGLKQLLQLALDASGGSEKAPIANNK